MKTIAAGVKAISLSGKGAAASPNRHTRITRGKGPTAANPVPRKRSIEDQGGLKGPYHA